MIFLKSFKKARIEGNGRQGPPPTGNTGKIPSFARKRLPSFLEGLSDVQINRLYKFAEIKRLQPGEALFSKGDRNENVHIVLNGQVSLVTGIPFEKASLGPGMLLGVTGFMEQKPCTASAIASEASVIMTLGKKTFMLFDEETQVVFYQQMVKALIDQADILDRKTRQLSLKNSILAHNLYAARTAKMADYRESELIAGLIKKIPKLPTYAQTLSSKLLNDEADFHEIVDLIRQDPSLVAGILKSINSSYYGLRQKVSDINSAVLLLGFKSIYQLVMSEGLRHIMPDTSDFRQLHSHALTLSYLAFSLSVSSKVGIPVQMATIGLLHNLGQAVMALLKQRNANLTVLIDTLDRACLGAFLLEEWQLPALVCRTVKYQDFPEFAAPTQLPKDVVTEVSLIYLAQVCHSLLQGVSQKDLPLTFLPEYKKVVNLGTASLENILQKYILADLRKKVEILPLSVKALISRH